jgi:CRISPR-associated protein Cas2
MKPTETLIWVLYDIQKDKSRTSAAKRCKEAGLYRVQYSVFVGTIPRNRLDELSMQLESLIDPEVDKVYMFPMCDMDFKKVILQGQAFDQKLIRDEVKNLFL